MMDRDHLHLLIHEDLYVLPQDEVVADVVSEPTAEVASAEAPQEPATEAQKAEAEPEVIHVPKEELEKEVPEETPKIPEIHHDIPEEKEEAPKRIPLAVFHESQNPAETALLQKIIDACEVQPEDYKVFANGFNKEVLFEKALVFVPEAKAFYTPIPYKDSQFLCSRPLAHLMQHTEEKVKLWNALKQFVL